MGIYHHPVAVALAVLVRLAESVEVGSPERRAPAEAGQPLASASVKTSGRQQRSHLRVVR
jgi:hypothetical protein